VCSARGAKTARKRRKHVPQKGSPLGRNGEKDERQFSAFMRVCVWCREGVCERFFGDPAGAGSRTISRQLRRDAAEEIHEPVEFTGRCGDAHLPCGEPWECAWPAERRARTTGGRARVQKRNPTGIRGRGRGFGTHVVLACDVVEKSGCAHQVGAEEGSSDDRAEGPSKR